jgi:serine protease AprX
VSESKHAKCLCQAFTIIAAIFILLLPLYARSGETGRDLYWIFFSQKGSSSEIDLSSQSLERRLLRASAPGATEYDLPVDRAHIEGVQSSGAIIRVVSRWLNAVSIEADDEAIIRIRTLPYVARITGVATYLMPLPTLSAPAIQLLPKLTAFDYGPSFLQVSMLGIDSLQSRGFSGQGMLIGIMETGFDTSHAVFSLMNSRHNVAATRNFIDGGDDVMGPNDAQRLHGTAVLSAIAGFQQGELIGPAYGARYALAKTEILNEEIRAEEDYWVGAAEWMESLGVDIISSSLGYTDWYDTTQLDGRTAIITQAANIANSLGVIVVNSAGNEGNTPWRKVTPPADGDSVIAAGAVDAGGLVPDFSSRGPTTDGRIKPDFAALGVGDYVAIYSGGYANLSGTSFSAPLLAGGIAILLEGHPNWRISNVISNLKEASSMSEEPNNSIGWGVPNFIDAFFSEPYTSKRPSLLITPQPAHDSVIFAMTFVSTGTASLSVHDLSGTRIRQWDIRVEQPSAVRQSWDGRNAHGVKVASGIYICILTTDGTTIREKLAYFSR